MKKFITTLLIGFCKMILFLLLIISVPIIFNLIFHNGAKSSFWIIDSTLSGADWFSFWISYISTIISTILAYAALKLSKTIEISHQYEEASKNKDMFIIQNSDIRVQLSKDIEKEFDIEIVLPFNVQSLNDLKVLSACINFMDGYKIELNFNDEYIQGNRFKLCSLPENLKESNERIIMWKLWYQNMKPEFKTIEMRITYCYSLNSFNIKRLKVPVCTIESICQLEINPEDFKRTKTVNSVTSIINIKKEQVRRK